MGRLLVVRSGLARLEVLDPRTIRNVARAKPPITAIIRSDFARNFHGAREGWANGQESCCPRPGHVQFCAWRMQQEGAIFLYDGACGFCNSTVIFLLHNTAADRLAFCALQSDYAHALCRKHGVEQPDLSTAYFFDGSRFHMNSSAVLRAISLCSTPARFLAVGLIIPKSIRDYCYSVISYFRKHIRPGNDACSLLTADERSRFLCQ